ncbi:MAG TPA: hypothetical protein VF868_11250 [Bacteroidia bacterium]|jgi:hypothetical protein
MTKSLLIYFLILPFWLQSQTGLYSSLDGGALSGGISSIAVDTIENKLYVAGSHMYIGGILSPYKAKWNGINWDSIPELPQSIQHFQYIDTVLHAYGGAGIWKKQNGQWSEVASVNGINGVTGIEKYNGKIVIMGFFDSLNHIPFHHFAQYDGTNITTFSNDLIWPLYEGEFSSSAVFNNELYVGGYFVDTSGEFKEHHEMERDSVDIGRHQDHRFICKGV